MRFRGLAIWKQAVNFHLTHWKTLLPVLPLLCVPVVGDALHSLLIGQKVQRKDIFPRQSVREVWKVLPSLFAMKL